MTTTKTEKVQVTYTCPGCGKPVVATKIASATWVVDHGAAAECKYRGSVPSAGRW